MGDFEWFELGDLPPGLLPGLIGSELPRSTPTWLSTALAMSASVLVMTSLSTYSALYGARPRVSSSMISASSQSTMFWVYSFRCSAMPMMALIDLSPKS